MILFAATLAMLLANNVRVVYSIVVPTEDTSTEQMSNFIVRQAQSRDATSAAFERPAVTTQTPIYMIQTRSTFVNASSWSSGTDGSSPTKALPSAVTTGFTSPIITTPIPTAGPGEELETGIKIGMGVVVGFIGVALIGFLVEACYLRRKRRERALKRGVEEVERGERELTKGSEEIIVLESRVSIIFDDVSEEEDVEEQERGRNGMSLPRREKQHH